MKLFETFFLHATGAFCVRPAKGIVNCKYNQPRPQGFSRPIHFLREKPWDRG